MNTTSSTKNSDDDTEGGQEENEKDKISYLIRQLPVLGNLFNIHGKIGEGTFSSVFLATLKSPSSNHQKFAIKHLVPTCHPGRIERELQCLQDIGGTDHVVGLDLCLRRKECVAFVTPYMKHDRFPEYVHNMTVEETRSYMKALLVALRRVHKFNIIHRDVKPSNFLYDRTSRQYLLVDFGLAQLNNEEKTSNNQTETCKVDSQAGKRKRGDTKAKTSSTRHASKSEDSQCVCFGKPRVCSICLSKSTQTAPRAGTPGFRAPEVLLKYPSQTSAIDIWACGVIMLCILCGTHPFFRSPDDCTALAEITSVFGSSKMQQCARKLGKKLTFSENIPGIDIRLLCQKLQKRNSFHRDGGANTSSNNPNDEERIGTVYPMAAYDLLIRLLDPDHSTRITAEEAINHPFFTA